MSAELVAPENRAAPTASSTTLSGRVLLPDGSPAPSSSIVFVWDDRGRRREARGPSGEDGAFVLEAGAAGVRGGLVAIPLFRRPESSPAVLPLVSSGTEGIELRLGPSAPITLELRDEHDQAVERADVWGYWELGGHRLQFDPSGSRRGPWRIPRAPLPLVLSLSPVLHVGGWFGPFDPDAIGNELVIHVRAVPRLRGRITHEGAPVSGARLEVRRVGEVGGVLELDPQVQSNPEWTTCGESTADGSFEIATTDSGPHELLALAPAGSGSLVLSLDGATDREDLEIELDQAPAAIVGRIAMAGLAVDQVRIAMDDFGHRAIEADGSYRLPNLRPGMHRLWLLGGDPTWIEILGEDQGADGWVETFEGLWPIAGNAARTVTVRPGETARVNLDLATPGVARLSGSVSIDGAPPAVHRLDEWVIVPRMTLESFTAEVAAGWFEETGSFVLQTDELGEHRLRCELRFGEASGDEWVVLDRVQLVPGDTSWSFTVSTGSLRVLPLDDEHPLWIGPRARWNGPGDLCVFVEDSALDESSGERFFARVPVGAVQLERDLDGQRTVVDCVVRAGETTEVRWPQ